MEKKICQNCKKEFQIDSEDFNFYEKIKVPPPTFCFECRLARKLIWRNERSLYKRTCDLCKKNIISMYKADALFPVYCHDCWWSDKWNPFDYAMDCDFKIPFFEQFKKLLSVVPRAASYSTKNVNSEYVNYSTHNKDCYLVFGSWFNENCGYGQSLNECKECWDCLFIKKCELCFSSTDCTTSNRLYFSRQCINCVDSTFLYDCRNCQNCIFSWNLRNKNYYVFNKQVSKEEYEKIKSMLVSYEYLDKNFLEFKKAVREKAIHKFMTGEKNQNVSGEFIYTSKNVFNSYYIYDGENEKYAVRGGLGQKDAMDVFGVHAGELSYESNNIDFSSRVFFALNGENIMNSSYIIDCDGLNNSFGCISVRKKEYCILNKQYTKEKYQEMKEKIITHMSEFPYKDKMGRIYKYGEFFPFEFSPHKYNETLAQEYVPITDKKALEMGYAWDEVEEKNYVPTKSWKDLPNTIEKVDDSILSEIILCRAWDIDKGQAQNHKCTKAFKITPSELSMYRKFNLPLPRACPNTRNFELAQLRNLPNFWHRQCSCAGTTSKNKKYNNTIEHSHGNKPCENEFETSYSPDRPEIVYCETCYQQEIY